MGAGAFCAVAQGSPHQDAAIVHLSYVPKRRRRATPLISLVGKGICMDTGGHGLKTAKGMYGMHEDMNGSAVALGILKAASDLQLPVAIDAWLAIAPNHIGPDAYQPGDVVTALDGTTIEVVHTDAEGRMVLADTLTLAARFLSRFVGENPWIHMDLSAHRNEGGLGAVSDDVTGFGVAWGVAMLEKQAIESE